MPEENQSYTDETDNDISSLHTCACGEQHRHRPGSRSHRDECTSPKKFGETCCCAPGPLGEANRYRCGHNPHCR